MKNIKANNGNSQISVDNIKIDSYLDTKSDKLAFEQLGKMGGFQFDNVKLDKI
ncbi:hypothetical protein [Kingella negevensis]|uniref:hypothetical protein n=1 Tax=Kingella negevensis TaxID=1522312 RepID=UPI000AE65062|nr:hypothetical protein [Kingella negevensis]MDK4689577.1 hypothetical protein [Kingella negevensis]WII90423.1 hypothetical protein QEO93_08125 [Kingella negevensis]